ncbi:membrane-bound PQQ-dependent dehydrogenase, glucose/quinate/shikimate family [Devosia sp. A16]|uniref:membrane-bound PQQ-dependent dehydrogenase, glucose/quinate/shikimate family n=1 Tax=Devosia sp. A16 TaxID=1736675 RepID=UPI0006D76879|nr:membrane-bound PQQ-dependent dehydrogenase, glucose/quinate/shikimate family [Devosia sp. A16]
MAARNDRGIGFWLIMALAALLTVAALALIGGGAYLIVLGGSWYYALAGLALLATGFFLFRRSRLAVWIYAALFAVTVAWALWESGLNGWAQIPRIFTPFVVLLLVLACLPGLRSGPRLDRRMAAASLAGLVGIAGMALAFSGADRTLHAQEAPGATPADAPSGIVPAVPAAPTASYPMPEVGADWPAYGGSNFATRYSPLDQVTPQNVTQLEKVWEFRTGDLPEKGEKFGNQNTPIKVGDRLLLCSALNKVSALDAASGKEFWTYDPNVSTDAIGYNATCRGLAYYENPAAAATELCAARVVMNTLDARLIALDVETGQLCADFGNGGIVNLLEGIGDTAPGFYSPTSPPTIVRNVVVTASQVSDGQTRKAPSGVVRGWDVLTGELLWAWDMGRPGETGPLPEGEIYTPGTPNVWTIASGDNELGLVYMPTGNSAVDYWGGDRSAEENQFSTSLVALDVTDGSVRWSYQTVHYDVWDYDLGSQGTLLDYPTPDGPVPALLLPTKQAEFYVFNRATGELLVTVEERPAPTGGVEPERLSPTQPFVTDFPNLLKPDLTESNMWGITPLDQLFCRIQFHEASYAGRYTPPTADRSWIQYPGYNGGVDWGGVAVDTRRNILVTNYNDTPNYNRLVPREEVDRLGIVPRGAPGYANNPQGTGISPQAETPYGIHVNAGWRVPLTGMLCKEPPYGGIAAIDLNTRRVLWDRPFGTARNNGPFGIPSLLPFDIGTPNNGGSVVTAGGLIFIAAATDGLIRAIDIETGETIWSDTLPAGGQAGPMVYEAGGRQFLVINAGGHNFMQTPIGDYFIAYALPG